MNDTFSDREKRNGARKFGQGATPGSGGEESAFEECRHIQRGLQSLRVPPVNMRRIKERFNAQLNPRKNWFYTINYAMDWLPAPVFGAICFLLLYAGGMGIYQTYTNTLFPEVPPIERLSFQANESGKEISPAMLWEYRLQRGRFVTVPDEVSADMCLSDGSIISCSPETQLSVRFGQDRCIDLRSGSIAVQAASIQDSTLSVKTPLGQIDVTGTVFHVTVRRSNP